jgi:hypothetical protein
MQEHKGINKLELMQFASFFPSEPLKVPSSAAQTVQKEATHELH